MSEERVYTPDEVAERLKIARKTVMNMLRSGRLKGIRVGKFWRIRERDLQAFIESGAEPNRPEGREC